MKQQKTYRLLATTLALLVLLLATGSPMLLSNCSCKLALATIYNTSSSTCQSHTKAVAKSCCSKPTISTSLTTAECSSQIQFKDNCCCDSKVNLKTTKIVLTASEDLPMAMSTVEKYGVLPIVHNWFCTSYTVLSLATSAKNYPYTVPPPVRWSAMLSVWFQCFIL